MKKWFWAATLGFVVWALALKFAPESTLVGGFDQARFHVLSAMSGAFIGFMLGLVATRAEPLADEKRKFLYSAIGWSSIGLLLTWGPSPIRMVMGCVVGSAVGLGIAAVNYIVAKRRSLRHVE